MSASLTAYASDQGQHPVTAQPPETSLLVADSAFRSSPLDQPTDFVVKVPNAVDALKIEYRSLIWNQPLYTHNLTNNLLLFQLFNPATPSFTTGNPVYAVFARPWFGYTSFDGNPPGSSYQAPLGISYGFMMEYVLNNDLRASVATPNGGNLAFLYTPSTHSSAVPGVPIYQTGGGTANYAKAKINFRYSPSRGYTLWATDATDITITLQIKILPTSSWILNGHFIHGFGRYDRASNSYLPNPDFQNVYMAENIAYLLEDRYLVLNSRQLSRERTIQSYHNAPFVGFNDELAIIPLSKDNNALLQRILIGQDTTTIAIRFGTTHQEFNITMVGENGDVIQCDNIMDVVLRYGSFNQGIPGNPTLSPYWDPLNLILGIPAIGNNSNLTFFNMNYLCLGPYNRGWGNSPPFINPTALQYLQGNEILKFTWGKRNAKMLIQDVVHVISCLQRYN
jgi:hypothetical protein